VRREDREERRGRGREEERGANRRSLAEAREEGKGRTRGVVHLLNILVLRDRLADGVPVSVQKKKRSTSERHLRGKR
jgi:hypothetical protein